MLADSLRRGVSVACHIQYLVAVVFVVVSLF
jgi:hypothetical protein